MGTDTAPNCGDPYRLPPHETVLQKGVDSHGILKHPWGSIIFSGQALNNRNLCYASRWDKGASNICPRNQETWTRSLVVSFLSPRLSHLCSADTCLVLLTQQESQPLSATTPLLPKLSPYCWQSGHLKTQSSQVTTLLPYCKPFASSCP